ncbi:glycine-rich RNA-binding protein 4, mitochondrial isoform X1 [Arachis ipaensis]|uniref:glycine-rich RNA-binding protein 4, mitochondrial isoform X1 n=1 Tax=Arachis ipaensis TaxID=130454 RepID=UPI000A2B7B49|nr:glycine-rich RNA-binding protein 4, mitochondrial isoform X1 [Arachis ipaensis]XP_025641918.1 glycine-rich RNA-binding protein 4, mitochondrial isoform X1 [Arachis hypogaea]
MRLNPTLTNATNLLFKNSCPFSPLLFPRHSSTNLLVTGLSYDTNETVLRDAFEQHGEIIEVKVICDHVTGKSKGYGFVRFTTETSAATGRKEMHKKGFLQIIDGRRIRVCYAHKQA